MLGYEKISQHFFVSATFDIGKEEKQITICYNSKYAREGHDGVIDSLPYY